MILNIKQKYITSITFFALKFKIIKGYGSFVNLNETKGRRRINITLSN
jgi:hypothetical protein